MYKQWMIFTATSLVMLMINIDLMAVNLALGPIASSLKLGLINTQWIINAYLLAIGMYIILGGYLGQRYGARSIFLWGTTLFVIASLVIAFSPTIDTLIFFRFVQGIGAALALPVGLVLLAEHFPKHQLAMVMALSMAATGLGQAFGPYICGIILQFLNWRWIFLINIPIGLIALIPLFFKFDKKAMQQPVIKIDIIGNILLSVGLLFLLYGLNFSAEKTYTIPLLILLLGIIVLIIFGIYCKKSQHPLIDIRLFYKKYFVLTNGIRFLFQYCFFSLLFILGLFLINGLRYNPGYAGVIQLYMSIAFFITTIIVSKISNKIRSHKLTCIGLLVSTIAFSLLALLGQTISLLQLEIALVLIGVAVGILFATTTTMAMEAVEEQQRSIAIGIFLTIALIGGAIGVAISSSILQFQATYFVKHLNSAFITTSLLPHIQKVATGIEPISSNHGLMQAALAQFFHSVKIVMWISAIISFMSLLITLIFVKAHPYSENSETV